jgi:formate hydrogenlyase transcriptional activator
MNCRLPRTKESPIDSKVFTGEFRVDTNFTYSFNKPQDDTTKAGKRIRKISRSTLTLFQAYDWPGNIRQLQHVIERAVILCDGDTFSVDETWLTRDSNPAAEPSVPIGASLVQQQRIQSETGRQMIETALAATGGRIAGPNGAAARLGIARQTLDSKITALGIDKHRYRSR